MVLCVVVSVFAGMGFESAKPVWPQGEEKTMNSFFRFRGEFDAAEGAKALLESHGIRFVVEKTVTLILNREGTGSCPMEAAVKGCDEPAQMVSKIKETLERMKAK